MPAIQIPEDTFRRLSAQAALRRVTAEHLAAELLDQLTPASSPLPPAANPPGATDTPPAGDLPYDEWKKLFDAHMRAIEARGDRYPPGHVTDVSRESMYEGCGE